ncbi:response regulator transcription factor [Pseudoalteromonas luteoviolacea]|uniref:response regulator transcription factor n=1 Tax=Pseudoalteromonas luteoviolacea TaxID=43657 RepID=UPI001B35AC73|nr:response regulator transcription factor [Pseudoalteromonas luteoviolacea]MBQ4810826.1 response regulator transcription factor [Pseudoalteromonas luteoviolacea]
MAIKYNHSHFRRPLPVNNHILVVEDDITLNQQVCALLSNRGYQVDCIHDGEQGLSQALAVDYDLIILDIRLPTMEGYEILAQLRKVKHTPVLILSACGAEQERIKGLSLGADDYLSKPFNLDELVLRIEAILRRVHALHTQAKTPFEITLLDLHLNRQQQQAYFKSEPVDITAIQFKLLWQLAQNHKETLSKAFLYQSVLERQFSRYDRSLDMHLSRLRKKLVAVGLSAESISTVHGKGYKLHVSV